MYNHQNKTIERIVIESYASCGCPMIKLETFEPKVFFDEELKVCANVSVSSTFSVMLSPDKEDEGCYVLLSTHYNVGEVAKIASVLARKENLGDKVRVLITDKNWGKVCVKQGATTEEISHAIYYDHKKQFTSP